MKDRRALLSRLHRVEGQVRGVARMVNEDAYYIYVLTQVGAVKAAIDEVALLLLGDQGAGRAFPKPDPPSRGTARADATFFMSSTEK